MEQYHKPFNLWRTQEVEEVFDVNYLKQGEELTNWLTFDCQIPERQAEQVEVLRESLEERVEFWNEGALKFHFLGPLLTLVNYRVGDFYSFPEQSISLELEDGHTISGILDLMVAKGKQIPKAPFFTLHEYKPQLGNTKDPLGQLLVSMVAAQRQNEVENISTPIFGCYVIGRLWFFVYFENYTYQKSKAFDATDTDDLKQIVCALHYVRKKLEEL
ncbi:MAG: hypothetical protein AAF740_02840 [Bacteroidota bacterium]